MRPPDVGADEVVLFAVAVVVGAVEREVAQRGEFGLDPAQPGRLRLQDTRFHIVRVRPLQHRRTRGRKFDHAARDGGLVALVRGEVGHQVRIPGEMSVW